MKKIEVLVQRFTQGSQEYISTILPFENINDFSELLIYGESEYGYQRNAIKTHFNKIKEYLLNGSDQILPTSIILGADKNKINKLLSTPIKENICKLTIEPGSNDKLFRIVDGQHRLRGVEEASKQSPELLKYLFNVVILLIDERKRSTELNVFTTINSKAKRIKVDLAELAKFNYEILENEIEDLTRHISIKTAFNLKENDPNNIWHKAIKFDIHSEVNLGIVGVTAFCESIEAIVRKYIEIKNVKPNNENKSDTIHKTEIAAKEIAKFIEEAWYYVQQKWPACFSENYVVDNEGELVKTFFDGNYYLQRTFGSKTINVILGEIVKEHGLNKNSLKVFNEIILKSRLKSEDWKTGNIFAGLSSDSGFRKARQIIKNEEFAD